MNWIRQRAEIAQPHVRPGLSVGEIAKLAGLSSADAPSRRGNSRPCFASKKPLGRWGSPAPPCTRWLAPGRCRRSESAVCGDFRPADVREYLAKEAA